MTELNDHHERWHDEIAAYALDALDEHDVEIVEEHLRGCEPCSERLRWLAPAVNELPASVPRRDPPPALRGRLMAIVREEAAEAGSAPSTVATASKRRWSRLPRFEGITLRPVLASAATLLLLVAGVAGYELRSEPSPSPSPDAGQRTFEASAGVEGPGASGTLEVNGDSGSLRVANMPPTAKGQVYQAWIRDDEGSVHPSTVFVLADDGTGAVSIPAGLSDAEQVMVTREPKGGSEFPHENALIAATLD